MNPEQLEGMSDKDKEMMGIKAEGAEKKPAEAGREQDIRYIMDGIRNTLRNYSSRLEPHQQRPDVQQELIGKIERALTDSKSPKDFTDKLARILPQQNGPLGEFREGVEADVKWYGPQEHLFPKDEDISQS